MIYFLSYLAEVPDMADGIGALISTLIFILVFLMISFHLLHETAAALIGAVAVLLITSVGGSYNQELEMFYLGHRILISFFSLLLFQEQGVSCLQNLILFF